ncbi:uncharacterized protein LOC122034432 [Zingiber officinale]|uniref:Calmodulin-binding domain-containing protein n=1 Tax=Zingiber officinale TaxID=94328 RepID=A0A8J5LW08_ZINOF|nr:uncharacterized protein LOC122034432 [Zingiber officinale]XP_042449629.1 uncharacterized protein LOC122034432 [Zingiber officinale]KAG6537453.1 hypothetical protein ZIOFF_002547 [Zingiber officinale]
MSLEAAERDIISVTPEISRPKSSVGRNLTGKKEGSSEEKPVPHYLRASTNSCHDLCKYGIKHDVEVKKRRPIRKKKLANKDNPIGEKDEGTVANKLERGKKDYSDLPPEKPENDMPPEKIIQISDLPTEKIIQLFDSTTNPEEVSVQGSMDWEFDFPSSAKMTDSLVKHAPPNQDDGSSEETTCIELMTPSSVSPSNASDLHESNYLSEGLGLPVKPISINLDQKAVENVIAFSEIGPTEGSSTEPVVVKLMVSSSTEHINASVTHTSSILLEEIHHTSSNLLEGISEELNATFPVQEHTASSEHITLSELDASPVEVSSVKPKNHKNAISARKELANGGIPRKTTTLYGANKRGQKVGPLVAKAKGDITELKSADENIGAHGRTKIIRPAKVMVSGISNTKEKNSLSVISKSVISSKTETKQMNNNLVAETTRTVKKRALSAGKTANESSEPANPVKARDLLLKAMSQSTSSENLNQLQSDKISKVSSHSGREVNKVLGQSLSSLSVRSLTRKVSTRKLCKNRNITPIPLVKIENRAGKLGPKKESGECSGPKQENINLRSLKQNVRKHVEVNKSVGKEGNIGSKSLGVNEPDMRQAVAQGSSIVISKDKIGKPHRRTASIQSDKLSTPLKLKFSRGKVVNLQSENKAPRILKFRQAKIASDKQNAKGDVDTKFTVISKSQIDRPHRRTASVHLEDKFSTPQKLKFRRGKVTSLQPENNVPRILRFRRCKLASDNQNDEGDFHTKFLRSGRSVPNSNASLAKALLVVLKHQDVQKKKDTQRLLNQVIEETASKLVVTRKSKVKALVGAFETVISLHEGKVSPPRVPPTLSDASFPRLRAS